MTAQHFFCGQEERSEKEKLNFFSVAFWQKEQRILGSAKGRGTTYFLSSKDLFGVDMALRHYYRGGLVGKMLKDFYFLPVFNLEKTRSFAEFHLLEKLYREGVNVPRPILAHVKKIPFGYQADLLSERIENASDLTDLLQKVPLGSIQWQQIGQLIAQMHALQVCHRDLNAHNILLQRKNGKEKFYLIDFDKCDERSGKSWKKENLARLKRSFLKEKDRLKIFFEEDHWQELLKGYHG